MKRLNDESLLYAVLCVYLYLSQYQKNWYKFDGRISHNLNLTHEAAKFQRKMILFSTLINQSTALLFEVNMMEYAFPSTTHTYICSFRRK